MTNVKKIKGIAPEKNLDPLSRHASGKVSGVFTAMDRA